MLPSKGWSSYEDALQKLGEHRGGVDADSLEFLASLSFVTADGQLSAAGRRFFELLFIEEAPERAIEVLRHQLLTSCQEAAAICQLLTNRPKVARNIAETVLRSQGFGDHLTDRRLGSLLALMSRAEIIEYSKRDGTFRVLVKPLTEPELPDSVFISPDTPWSNRRWLARLLGEGRDFIYWLDKHFLPEGLDFIGEGANGARISTVRVISLALEENHTRKAKRAYRDLARELRARGISFEWRFIDSKGLRDTHDRWIITRGRAWNVPNLHAILSGQRSELTASGNADGLKAMFEDVWQKAPERMAEPGADSAAA